MLRKWIRKTLTTVQHQRPGKRRKLEKIEVPPSERLVLGVTLIIVALIGLVALELAHVIFLRSWNSEVFAAITGLIGTISGVFLGVSG